MHFLLYVLAFTCDSLGVEEEQIVEVDYGPIPMSGLTNFIAHSREISKALGLSQCRIPKGVRV